MVGGSLLATGVSLCQGSAGHGFPIEGVIIFVFEENRRGVLINHKLTPNKCLCFLRNFKRSIKANAPSRTKLMSSSPPRHQGGLMTCCALEGGELCTIIRTIYIAGQGNHRCHHHQHPYVLQAANSRYPDTTSLQRSLRVARGHWSVLRASVA